MLSFSAAALGLVIVDVARWPILLLAVLNLQAAHLYTGGPCPLDFIAFGELTVFGFMGSVMVVGDQYVVAGVVAGTILDRVA